MIAAAVSGGVDSLASLLLLKKAGHDIFAVHALLHAKASVPAGLSEACDRVGVPLHVLDLKKTFEEKVIAYFIDAFSRGLTPNPCAICNREIKFGSLWRAVRELGAYYLATGHYAKLDKDAGNNVILGMAADARKDQSYFLSMTPKESLANVIFPLAGMIKTDARQFVASAGYAPPVPAESQDICFLGSNGREEFLAPRIPCVAGPILLCEKAGAPLRLIGEHKGLWKYTAGQRRGLGVAWKEPLYVRQIDCENNTVVLAPRGFANMRGVRAGNLNIFVDQTLWPGRVFAKLRYNQKMAPATALLYRGMLEISLLQPMLATAPGQIAAIYDDSGNVLCGGIVRTVVY